MNPNLEKPFTFDRVVRLVITLVLVYALFYLLHRLRSALIPFFLAWLFAYLLHPVVSFFQRKLRVRKPGLPIFLTIFLALLILSLIGLLLAKPVSMELYKMAELLKSYSQSGYDTPFFPDDWEQMIKEWAGLPQNQNLFTKENSIRFLQQILPEFWQFFSSSINLLLSVLVFFIVLLYIVFILMDYEKISQGWVNLVPLKFRPFFKQLSWDLVYNMNRYFRGQALIASLVGIMFAIGFKIIGLPLGLILGLFIGLLNLVPYLQIVGFIPTTIMAILKSMETGQSFWMIFLTVIIIFAIVQGIQDGFLVPRIMGKVTGLNPAIILLSLSIWGSLLGILGMIIALPTTTIIISYYRRFILWEGIEPKEKEKKDPSASSKKEA